MTTKKQKLLLGAHMSISGGIEKAIERGASIGCTTIQIFTKSNRQWNANPLTADAIAAFKKAAAIYQMHPIVAHATYLINIASSNPETEKKSIDSLIIELDRTDQLEIPYLVLHPGSNGDQEAIGIHKIIQNLNSILDNSSSNTHILLETMAGQGSTLCYSFEQIGAILKKVKQNHRLGVCLDTCHVFAAGYDLANEKGYSNLWKVFEQMIGLEKLKVLHINDSKKELGSRVDRHEHIGKGKIGLKAFELLFNDARFFDIPKILETPKVTKDPFVEDRMNISTIHSLLWPETKKILGLIKDEQK